MATVNLGAKSVPANVTVEDISKIARALQRLNKIQSAPVLSLEDRAEVTQAKALCWSVVGSAAEALVSLMDAISGDPDIELNGDEDDFMYHGGDGPGCPIADPGGCEHDGCEPDYDDKVQTWSHPDDHPAEMHIGSRHTGKDA